MLQTILIHVSKVVDHGPIITDLPPKYQQNYGDRTRTHTLCFFGSCIDDSVPPKVSDGGHCFGGHKGSGSAGGSD
jgi:hypothetical protein